MKPIKMFGLAALAALLAMAFIGAASAMAESTVLCKADESPCSAANAVTSVHETTVSGSPAELLSSAGNVKCDVLFSSTSVGAEHEENSQTIEGNFTYSNCVRNGTESCTVEEKNGPVAISVLKEGHETGAVTGKGEVNVHCGSFINCTYNGTGLTGTAKGPLLSSKTNGSVELSEQTTNHVSGLFCPATAKLDITTTPLVATYISAGLHYCVEYAKAHGFYTSATCATNSRSRSTKFMLVVGPGGLTVGTTVCARLVPTPHTGLYSNSACTTDVADNSLWEKGTIKLVQ